MKQMFLQLILSVGLDLNSKSIYPKSIYLFIYYFVEISHFHITFFLNEYILLYMQFVKVVIYSSTLTEQWWIWNTIYFWNFKFQKETLILGHLIAGTILKANIISKVYSVQTPTGPSSTWQPYIFRNTQLLNLIYLSN